MLRFLIWMYEMKMSFQSDLCMISFSIPFFFFLLLIVWLPPYCCNMLPLWSRSRGGVPCGCQFMKQEVPRGQGASFKDFHLLFSLYRCLNNNKHSCCCVVNMLVILPYMSLPGFVLSTDVVYPQSPGAVERNSAVNHLLRCRNAAFCTNVCPCLSPQSSNDWKKKANSVVVTWLMTFSQT